MFVSTPSFASGKVIVQGFNSIDTHQNKIPSMVGLSIYENILLNIYYEQFSSYSNATVEDFVQGSSNINSKHLAHIHIGNFTAGAGFQLVHFFSSVNDYRVVAQLTYKIW